MCVKRQYCVTAGRWSGTQNMLCHSSPLGYVCHSHLSLSFWVCKVTENKPRGAEFDFYLRPFITLKMYLLDTAHCSRNWRAQALEGDLICSPTTVQSEESTNIISAGARDGLGHLGKIKGTMTLVLRAT